MELDSLVVAHELHLVAAGLADPMATMVVEKCLSFVGIVDNIEKVKVEVDSRLKRMA